MTKPQYETVEEKEITIGEEKNKFIAIARKKVEEKEFISISKGRKLPNGEKIYQGGIGIPDDDEVKKFISEAIKKI